MRSDAQYLFSDMIDESKITVVIGMGDQIFRLFSKHCPVTIYSSLNKVNILCTKVHYRPDSENKRGTTEGIDQEEDTLVSPLFFLDRRGKQCIALTLSGAGALGVEYCALPLSTRLTPNAVFYSTSVRQI